MTTTPTSRRAATPARVWVPSTALPSAATLALFYLATVVEEPWDGWVFSAGLTFLVIAAVIGPLICWAYRTSDLEDRLEDELSDARYRIGRLEADMSALSLALQAVTGDEARVVGWIPPGPTPPRPPLHLVRDDAEPEWN